MRWFALLLLISGWFIAMAAFAMLRTDGLRMAFAFAGFLVQLLGMGMLFHSYRATVTQSEGR